MACENVDEQCRLCLSSTSPEKCIFTTEDDNKISLATKIMVCTSLVVSSNDDKPQYLCLPCEEILESFFEFRNKCLHSHFQLCFDADVITNRTSPSKNVKESSCLTDSCIVKQEQEELFEELSEDYSSSEITSPPLQFEQQTQLSENALDENNILNNTQRMEYRNNALDETNLLNNTQRMACGNNTLEESNILNNSQRMECGNCLNGFYSLEELDEHWNSCGANKNRNEEWHKELVQLNSKKQDLNYINSNNEVVNCNNIVADIQTNNTDIRSTSMKCVGCVKVFKNPKKFTEHLLAHSSGTRFNCRECPKSFIDHYELKYHMRIHSGDDKYKCKDCGKIFPRPSSLRRHALTHSLEKPYKCKFCSKTFAQPYNIPAHERTHTGEKPYKCRFCSKLFYERSAKVKHEKNHVRSNKMFQCDLCNRMFSTHKEMDEHFNSHDSQMVWKCRTCKQEYRKPSLLKAHALKLHDDNLPFGCEICFDSFALHNELKSHINIHTGDIS